MAVDERRIAILGAGKIGEALIGGLLSSGWREPAEISASTRREERIAELRE
ncbi:MAG: NAD(P)-binding domain-containing protein, partial [Actinobacteria bacterium]|nr:NAD(P)-binding domain-containing protein [Actinomycetota bacterium]